jgi:hypothetical protein
MCGSILTHADRIVRGRMNDLELLECPHANSRRGVEVEHEKGGCHWNDGVGREGGDAVGNGAHGVLADAVMQIAACVVACYAAGCFEVRLGSLVIG